MNFQPLIIAIDFDGTIVNDKYPKIGKPKLFAFETIKSLQKKKHKIILWTYRSGKYLSDAIEFCRKKGIEFYAVNQNFPGEIYSENESRKIHADIFIDDRNIGGMIEWGEIYKLIENQQIEQLSRKSYMKTLKKWFT